MLEGHLFTYVPNLTKKSHGALCIPDHPVHSCILIESISQHMRIRGYLYSKFSFGEVYRQIYGQEIKFYGDTQVEP